VIVPLALWFRRSSEGEYAHLLQTARVDTVAELAQHSPESLHSRLKEVNGEIEYFGWLPTLKQVIKWIECAKGLRPTILY
jgi:hypothetical protein